MCFLWFALRIDCIARHIGSCMSRWYLLRIQTTTFIFLQKVTFRTRLFAVVYPLTNLGFGHLICCRFRTKRRRAVFRNTILLNCTLDSMWLDHFAICWYWLLLTNSIGVGLTIVKSVATSMDSRKQIFLFFFNQKFFRFILLFIV